MQLKVTGTLKFFYASENYGFLVSDSDQRDVFFHYDDM
jgi:cold shock CspA family protein